MLTGSGLTGRSGIAMPDEHGRLTEADNDLIQRWWGQHWKDDDPVICPVCKTTDWKTAGHLVNIPTHAPDAKASHPPTYPHSIFLCKFCAHSLFSHAVQIGIPDPPARRPTARADGPRGPLELARGSPASFN